MVRYVVHFCVSICLLIPGEKERQVMTDRLNNGVPLANEAWKDILNAARNAGVAQSKIDRILA